MAAAPVVDSTAARCALSPAERSDEPDVTSTPLPRARGPAPVVGLLLVASLATAAIGPPAIGVLSPFLITEFDLSRTHIGLLVTATGLAGAIMSPFVGRWVDRLGWHTGFGLNFGIGIAGFTGIALAPAYGWLVVAVLLSGLSNSFADPVTNRFIVETLPVGRRGVMVGVKQAGGPVGVFIAAASLPYLALQFGWRSAAASIVILPLGGLVLGRVILPQRVPRTAPAMPAEGSVAFTNRPLAWSLTIYAVLMGGAQAVVLTFLPLYAHEGVGVSVQVAGGIAAAMGLVGVLSRVLLAIQAERWGRFSLGLGAMSAASVGAIVLFLAAPALGPVALLLGGALAGASMLAWMAVLMITIVVAVSQHEIGKVSGQVIAGFLIGYTVAPTAFALGVDLSGVYWPSWTALAGTCMVAGAVAFLVGRALPSRSNEIAEGAG